MTFQVGFEAGRPLLCGMGQAGYSLPSLSLRQSTVNSWFSDVSIKPFLDEDPTVYDVEETTRELVQDQFVISPFEEGPQIKWRHPLLAALLICICLLTVLGNLLVVTAVCTKRYLR